MPPKGTMIAKVCENPACAKQMQVWPSRAEKKRFCSVACMKAMRLSKVCERPGCDVAFTCWPSRAARQYCSIRCRNIVNSEKARLVPNTNDRTSQHIPEMIELYQSGVSTPELATHYGVSTFTICRRLKLAGITLRDRGNQKPWSAATRKKNKDTERNVGTKNPNYLPLPEDQVRVLYESGMSAQRVGHALGCSEDTVLTRLRQIGMTIRKAGYSGYRSARDGHMVQSGLEEAIDNWLFDHGIPHEVQPPCPWSKNGQQGRADFRVGNVYIEVWGIIRDPRYSARQQQKLALYRQCGADLIQMYPHHIHAADYSPLERLLTNIS